MSSAVKSWDSSLPSHWFFVPAIVPRTKGASGTEYQIDLEAFASANFSMFFSAWVATYMFYM